MTRAKTTPEKKISADTKAQLQQRAEAYLHAKGLRGWSFRDAKVYKAHTIIYLTRGRDAETYCAECRRHHDKDNTLALKFTAKKIAEICLKKSK